MAAPILTVLIIFKQFLPIRLEKMLWLEADRMGFLLDAVTQKKFEISKSNRKE